MYRKARVSGNLEEYVDAIVPEIRKHDMLSSGGMGAVVKRGKKIIGTALRKFGLR